MMRTRAITPVASKLSKLTGWIARDHCIRWHVHHHHSSGGHYAALSDSNAWHNDCSVADPNIVFDDDWFNLIVCRRRTRHARDGIRGVPWRIKNQHLSGNSAVPTNN